MEVGDVGVEVDTNGGEVSVGDVGVEVGTGGGDVAVGVGAGDAVRRRGDRRETPASRSRCSHRHPGRRCSQVRSRQRLDRSRSRRQRPDRARARARNPTRHPAQRPTPAGSAPTPGTPGPILAVPAGRPDPDGSVTTRSPAVDGVPGQKVAAPTGTIAPPVDDGCRAAAGRTRQRPIVTVTRSPPPRRRRPRNATRRRRFKLGLGPGGGVLGDLALLLFIFIPAGVLLLSAVPGRAGPPGVGRSIAEERVTIVGVAVAMWVGVAVVLLLDRR